MGTLQVLDHTGHTSHSWDTPEEAQVVGAVFDELRGKGYMAAAMSSDGQTGSLLSVFDPSAGSILMIPPLAGG